MASTHDLVVTLIGIRFKMIVKKFVLLHQRYKRQLSIITFPLCGFCLASIFTSSGVFVQVWPTVSRVGGRRGSNDTGRGAMWAGHGGGRRGSQDGNPFGNQGDYYQHDTFRS